MRMKYILSFLFSFFTITSFAQTIEGTVANSDGVPIDHAVISIGSETHYSDERGKFTFVIPSNQPPYFIVGRMGYFTDTIYIPEVVGIYVLNIQLIENTAVLGPVEIEAEGRSDATQVDLNQKNLASLSGPQGGVEGLLRTLPGVVGKSELSSQYNVRGGSFDENLVYVNGIEVYRPFLVRAGQQEGMSFINSSMVDKISFSAGGFSAMYGDKMSSVLDITYKQPKELEGTFEGSMLGGQLALGGQSKNGRLSAIGGIRYRTNRLLLGALDTDGDFTSNFTDAQILLGYQLTDEWRINFLGNYATNDYRVKPGTRNTQFGSFQEALQLTVYFDGQENYTYNTKFGALSAEYNPNSDLSLSFYSSAYQTVEREYVDVIGEYRLGDLNTNLGSDDFGEIAAIRGVGGFHQYARNTLDAIIFNLGHRGVYHLNKGSLYWGARVQREDIVDRYKEWENIDSAGYAVPYKPTEIVIGQNDTFFIPNNDLNIFQSFDTRGSVASFRTTGYIEYVLPWVSDSNQFRLTTGIRSQHWSLNNQLTVSPRISLSWKPAFSNKWLFKAASGMYHQPAFYREMRSLSGNINRNIRAQLAVHYVVGGSYSFKMFDRNFVWNNEIYFKDMYHLIPYELDNVRIRYTARNEARGYAYGFDSRINGEFVKGVESWMSLSIFRVMENIDNDGHGYIPRPTDQLFSFAMFYQDYLPKDPSFRVTLNLVVTGGFPFGAPQTPRYSHTLRSPLYRRLDLGFIKVLRQRDKQYRNRFYKSIDEMWIGLEVFNMLGARNTVSYLWVRDISAARQYAVPNYLTSRLLNLKLHINF